MRDIFSPVLIVYDINYAIFTMRCDYWWHTLKNCIFIVSNLRIQTRASIEKNVSFNYNAAAKTCRILWNKLPKSWITRWLHNNGKYFFLIKWNRHHKFSQNATAEEHTLYNKVVYETKPISTLHLHFSQQHRQYLDNHRKVPHRNNKETANTSNQFWTEQNKTSTLQI